jgi:hypothetical protein
MGIEGGYEMQGLSGLIIRLAISELGPLGVQFTASSPTGILLDPASGLTLNNFVGGVEFFKSLPTMPRNPKNSGIPPLRLPVILIPCCGSPAHRIRWWPQYKKLKENPSQAGFTSAFTSPMLITGGAKLYTQYGSEYSVNGNVQFKIDTSGRMLIGGTLKFFGGLLTASAKLYLDLSQVAEGSARILFLSDVPDQAPMLITRGKFEMGFFNGTDTATSPGGASSVKPSASIIYPASGGHVGLQQLQTSKYIDVAFETADGVLLDLTTVSDAGESWSWWLPMEPSPQSPPPPLNPQASPPVTNSATLCRTP